MRSGGTVLGHGGGIVLWLFQITLNFIYFSAPVYLDIWKCWLNQYITFSLLRIYWGISKVFFFNVFSLHCFLIYIIYLVFLRKVLPRVAEWELWHVEDPLFVILLLCKQHRGPGSHTWLHSWGCWNLLTRWLQLLTPPILLSSLWALLQEQKKLGIAVPVKLELPQGMWPRHCYRWKSWKELVHQFFVSIFSNCKGGWNLTFIILRKLRIQLHLQNFLNEYLLKK